MNLLLVISKTERLVDELRRKEDKIHTPVCISMAEMEQVRLRIVKNQSCCHPNYTLVRKAQT